MANLKDLIVNGSARILGNLYASNMVTSISSSSTDSQFPSAKCVYDAIGSGGGANTTLSNVTALDSSFIALLKTNGFIPQTYSISSSSGYIVFSNKLCFQWGAHGASNSEIPLSITMADTDYLVFSSRIDSGSCVKYTKATTTIKPNQSWAANWMVVGLSV